MRIRLVILGTEVWSLHWGEGEGCDCEAEDGETEEESGTGIRGGETHDFERDTAPLDPADHYGEWEDRTRFGFGRR
jgi:hypothetical protein